MATTNVPGIARDMILRALDALADRVATVESDVLTPVQRLGGTWRSLNDEERNEVAGYVGSAAEALIAAIPVAVAATRRRVRRRRPSAPAPRVMTVPDSDTDTDKNDKKKKKDKKNKKSKKDKKKNKKKNKKDKKKKK